MIDSKAHHTKLIKNEAKRLGFLSCGISEANFLEEEAPRLEKWLNNNMVKRLRVHGGCLGAIRL